MIPLNNFERLALHAVANFDCTRYTDINCNDCPYFAHVENNVEDFVGGCISIYLKQTADKYYTERTDK